MARKFFYVCGGIMMLALAYHFGATNAGAQASSNAVVAVADQSGQIVFTANGDVYYGSNVTGGGSYSLVNNVFAGPTPVQQTTFGALKAKYR